MRLICSFGTACLVFLASTSGVFAAGCESDIRYGTWSFADPASGKLARGGVTAEGRNDLVGLGAASPPRDAGRAWETFELFGIPGQNYGRWMRNTIDGRWLETINNTNTLNLKKDRSCDPGVLDMQWSVEPVGSGSYVIRNMRNKQYVRVVGGLLKANTDRKGATAFKFVKYAAASPAPAPAPAAPPAASAPPAPPLVLLPSIPRIPPMGTAPTTAPPPVTPSGGNNQPLAPEQPPVAPTAPPPVAEAPPPVSEREMWCLNQYRMCMASPSPFPTGPWGSVPAPSGQPPYGPPGGQGPGMTGQPPYGGPGGQDPGMTGQPPYGGPGGQDPGMTGQPPYGGPGGQGPGMTGQPPYGPPGVPGGGGTAQLPPNVTLPTIPGPSMPGMPPVANLPVPPTGGNTPGMPPNVTLPTIPGPSMPGMPPVANLPVPPTGGNTPGMPPNVTLPTIPGPSMPGMPPVATAPTAPGGSSGNPDSGVFDFKPGEYIKAGQEYAIRECVSEQKTDHQFRIVQVNNLRTVTDALGSSVSPQFALINSHITKRIEARERFVCTKAGSEAQSRVFKAVHSNINVPVTVRDPRDCFATERVNPKRRHFPVELDTTSPDGLYMTSVRPYCVGPKIQGQVVTQVAVGGASFAGGDAAFRNQVYQAQQAAGSTAGAKVFACAQELTVKRSGNGVAVRLGSVSEFKGAKEEFNFPHVTANPDECYTF